MNVLTEGLKDLTGGQLIIETEVEDAAQKFEEIIKEKEQVLELIMIKRRMPYVNEPNNSFYGSGR